MKNIGFPDGVHALIKQGASDNQLSMAKYVHRAVQHFEKEVKPLNDYQDLSQVIEKLDTLLEQTKPKTRAKKIVAKIEYKCSFQQKLIDYRKEIKKPLKTERGLNQLVASIEECAKAWIVTREQVLDYMMSKEWQSVKPEYENPYIIKQPAFKSANNQSIDDLLG